MLAWLLALIGRYAIFLALVLGLAQGLSWVLGEDAKVSEWASANRPLTSVVIAISFIIYALYDWLREPPK